MRPLRHRLRLLVGHKPALYFAATRFSPRLRALAVRRDTQLVIEGYPRSGNTFAVRAFRSAQPDPVRLAHHLHVPAQVQRGVAWRVPVLVLLRDPVDAVASSLQRLPWQSADDALREWIWFHAAVLPVRGGCEIATFEAVTSQFGDVVERVNARFGTRFVPFDHSPTNVQRVFDEIDDYARQMGRGSHQVSRPTEDRKARREALVEQVRAPRYRELLDEATELYQALRA